MWNQPLTGFMSLTVYITCFLSADHSAWSFLADFGSKPCFTYSDSDYCLTNSWIVLPVLLLTWTYSPTFDYWIVDLVAPVFPMVCSDHLCLRFVPDRRGHCRVQQECSRTIKFTRQEQGHNQMTENWQGSTLISPVRAGISNVAKHLWLEGA